MKKVILVIMTLALCVALSACGSKTMNFDGNFTEEANEEAVTEVLNAIETKAIDETSLPGVYVKVKGTIKISDQEVKYDMIMKIQIEDGKIKMSGEGTAKGAGQDFDSELYYVGDGYMYTKVHQDGESMKMKLAIPDFDLTNVMSSQAGGVNFDYLLDDLKKNYSELTEAGVKVYIDKDKETTKIKMTRTMQEQEHALDYTFVVESGNVTGLKVVCKNEIMDLVYEYAKYTGTVKVPSSFDGYIEM